MLHFEKFFQEGIKLGASDLHISSTLPPSLRINGELTEIKDAQPVTPQEINEFTQDLVTREKWDSYVKTGDLDFGFSVQHENGKGSTRIRASVFRELRGCSATFRFIPARIRSIDELGLPAILKDFAAKHRGLFLTTGPTGSGKSSTLAAVINEINETRNCHIVTAEDPIEYIHTSKKAIIHHREVGSDTQTFASAIRHVLRQDPDVILIGEMRDLETIAAAITAAETGHLVLGTLHTQDASQSVERLIDVFPPHQQNQIRLQLSYILIGICSQQLIATTDFSGIATGRACATEILIANPAVRASIREGKANQLRNTMQTGASIGMHTMEQDLARLIRDGVLTREAALRNAYDPAELERTLSKGF